MGGLGKVGCRVGFGVCRLTVGRDVVGRGVGSIVGVPEGTAEGTAVGVSVGAPEGLPEGLGVGASDGALVSMQMPCGREMKNATSKAERQTKRV